MAILGRRQPFKPLIRTLGAPAPIARLVRTAGRFAAQQAANYFHRPLFRIILNRPVPPTPTGGKLIVTRGAFAAQQAANFAHRPLFPIRIGTFVPRQLAGVLKKPFLARVPDPGDRNRLTRHTELLSTMWNSLVRQGFLQQTAPATYVIIGGGFVMDRAPGATDDEAIGANPGSTWVDQTSQKVWWCIDNTRGAAVWKTPF